MGPYTAEPKGPCRYLHMDSLAVTGPPRQITTEEFVRNHLTPMLQFTGVAPRYFWASPSPLCGEALEDRWNRMTDVGPLDNGPNVRFECPAPLWAG